MNQLADRVPDGSVVVDQDGLHSLDEPPLDVTGLGRLDGGTNETFSSAHGVEVEPAGREAGQVRVLDEPARLDN